MNRKLSLILFCGLFSFSVGQGQNISIAAFDEVHQRFGGENTRDVVDTFNLSSSIEGFSQILMHVDLSCPPGGCDPWDRFASVSLKKGEDWLEIGRYITPYNKACGWAVDVTDYSTLLTGEVILKSFIDTWVDPAWLVTVTFEYIEGTPTMPLTEVENVWRNYNLVYGDTTQADSFPVASLVVPSQSDSVKLKVVLTGHGQGNTDNAAEFSQKNHEVYVNGEFEYSHYLWRADCNSNTCSPQSGSWQYNRAGWCPGADVNPAYFDLTSLTNAGSSIELDYQLESYFNTCSPNNPSCTTNGNCPDCQYNYNGHTQPYYAMSSQLISYDYGPTSVSELEAIDAFSITPNPTFQENGFTINLKQEFDIVSLDIFNLLGESVAPTELLNQRSTKLNIDFPSGVFFVVLRNEDYRYAKKLIVQ
jgi:hypothetical protein